MGVARICMKMTLPLCCGRRLYAFLRYILRLERHFPRITEGLYDKFYVAACICLHFYDINEECKKSNMPFVCIFTVVKVILESPPAPRDAPDPPGASQGLPEHQNKYFACIFTIRSMLRQASCMHFYDIFYVPAGILYAFLRYILCDGRRLLCIFTIYYATTPFSRFP